MEIDLGLNKTKPDAKTPVAAKKLRTCILEYEDGTILELPVEEEQGFHRISDYSTKGKVVTIHEVFITYGKDIDGDS